MSYFKLQTHRKLSVSLIKTKLFAEHGGYVMIHLNKSGLMSVTQWLKPTYIEQLADGQYCHVM